jgi:hypothetical protein
MSFRGLPISANVPEVTSKVRLWDERYRRTGDHGCCERGQVLNLDAKLEI